MHGRQRKAGHWGASESNTTWHEHQQSWRSHQSHGGLIHWTGNAGNETKPKERSLGPHQRARRAEEATTKGHWRDINRKTGAKYQDKRERDAHEQKPRSRKIAQKGAFNDHKNKESSKEQYVKKSNQGQNNNRQDLNKGASTEYSKNTREWDNNRSKGCMNHRRGTQKPDNERPNNIEPLDRQGGA